MQDILDNVRPDISPLYHKIQHDIDIIHSNLSQDISKIEKTLDSKLISQQKDFQDEMSEWLQHETKTLFSQITNKSDKLTQECINTLTKTLTESIQNAIKEKLENLKSEIDLKDFVDSIKSDKALIERIKQDSIQKITNELLNNKDAMLNEAQSKISTQLYEYLKNKINLDSITKSIINNSISKISTAQIKNEITTQINQTTQNLLNIEPIKQEMQNKLKDINTYINTKKDDFNKSLTTLISILKSDSTNKLQDIANDLISHIDSLKIESNTNLTNFKSSLETLLLELKEDNKEALDSIKQDLITQKEQIIADFNESLKNSTPQIITQAIENITNHITQNENYMLDIKTSVIAKGYEYIKEFEDYLKEAIIKSVAEYMIGNVTNEQIKDIMLKDERVVKILKDSSYDSTKDILNHALMKDFVISALKEKAKEILSNDELLRAEAEAQAHILYMRAQSELQTIGEVLDKLQNSYDIQHKLDILLEKEKLFQEALANAKKELENELKAELPKIDTKIEDAIKAYDKAQDSETDAKIKTLQTEILALMQTLQDELDLITNDTTNADGIAKIKEQLKDIETKLAEQEAINTKQDTQIEANTKLNEAQEEKDKDLESKLDKVEKDLQDSINNPQKPTGSNNKYLQWN